LNNIKIALFFVELLLNKLRGKIIITSDHGDLLGEDGKLGHDTKWKHPKLNEVPYVEILK